MPSLMNQINNRSNIYLYAFLVFTLFFLYILLIGNIAGNEDIVWGAFAIAVLLLLSYINITYVYLAIIFFLPYLIGLDSYQINVGPFLSSFLPFEELYLNLFTLTCLFVIFLGTVETLRNGLRIIKVPLSLIISLVLFISLISFLNSQYQIIGIVFLVYLISGFMAYFLGYYLLGTKKRYLETSLVIIGSSIIPVLVAFSQLLAGNYLFEADSALGRIKATFPHSNTFGSYLYVVLTIFVIMIIAVKLKGKKKNKISDYQLLSYLPFFVFIPLLILTYSRTAWIGFALSLGAISLIRADIRLLIIYSGSFGLFLMMLYEKTRDRILGTFERHMFDALYGRFEIWDMALFEARKKPLIGYGIGSFEEVIRTAQGKETGNVYPHNDSIRFILEGGVLGLVGYVLYMAGAIFYSLKSYLRYPQGIEEIALWGRNFQVDFKLLGFIPFLLFSSMVIISLVEAPSMDFVYQIISWTMLGSWLGMNENN